MMFCIITRSAPALSLGSFATRLPRRLEGGTHSKLLPIFSAREEEEEEEEKDKEEKKKKKKEKKKEKKKKKTKKKKREILEQSRI